jgi:hypothetical protein
MISKASSEENEFKAEEILDPLSEALKKVESLTAELKAVRDELKITKENADSAAKLYQPDSGECSIHCSYDRATKFDYQFGFNSFDIVTYLWRSHKQLIFLENHTQYFIVEKLLILNKATKKFFSGEISSSEAQKQESSLSKKQLHLRHKNKKVLHT